MEKCHPQTRGIGHDTKSNISESIEIEVRISMQAWPTPQSLLRVWRSMLHSFFEPLRNWQLSFLS